MTALQKYVANAWQYDYNINYYRMFNLNIECV